MCYRIKVKKNLNKVHISAYGRIKVSQLKEIFYETVRHEDWQPGFNILCDCRKIEYLSVKSQDIEEIIEWHKSINTLIGTGRCAVVAAEDLADRINRLPQIQSQSVGSSQQLRTFSNMDEAESWLY